MGLGATGQIVLALTLGFIDGTLGALRGGGWAGLPAILAVHLCLQGLLSGSLFALFGPRPQWLNPQTWSSRGLLETILVLPLGAAVVSQVILGLQARFATPLYTGLFQSLTALGGLMLVWLALRRLLDWLPAGKLPRPTPLLLGLGGFFTLLYGWLWWRRDLLFREIDPWLPLAGALHLLLALSCQNRQKPTGRWLAWAVPPLAALLLFPTTMIPGSQALTWGQRCLGCRLIPPLAKSLDSDGDGVGHLLGGLDCDPEDPGVYPGAVEIPDDGVDQDCFGGDLTLDTGQASAPTRPSKRASPVSELVVLVTVDTLRADHMGLYGYRRLTTPGIDAWAKEGLVFERALSSAPYTTAAIPGMLTGRSVSELRSSLPDEIFRIPPQIPTLAERFQEAGFETAGFVTALNTAKGYGYRRGFDHFVELTRQYVDTAQQTVTRAEAWLSEHPKGKRFLWLHLFDPHAPYDHYPEFGFGRADVDRYDSTLAQMDRFLAPFLERLSGPEQALVLLSADHGESFGEHGHHKHGQDLYDPAMRVPFVLRGPGLEARRSETLASTLDIAATLCGLSGLAVPVTVYGKDLSPVALDGLEFPGRVAFAEQDLNLPQVLLGTKDHTLIYALLTGRLELYSTKDQDQGTNLWGQTPALDGRLRRQLARLVDQGPARRRAQLLSRAVVAEPPVGSTRLNPPQRFGDRIELVGYRFWSERVARERLPQFRLSLYLRALRPLKRRWKLALVLDMGGRKSNLDHHLAKGNLPSNQWPPGRLLHNPVDLGSLGAMPKAPARFALGFYAGNERLPPQGGPLPHTESKTRVWLGPFEAKP